jgi:benzoate-CoA ligase
MKAYAAVDHGTSPPTVTVPREYNAALDFVDRHLEEGRGEHPAFIDRDGAHSYASFAAGTHRVAHALRALGLRQEDRVMMAMVDTVAFPETFWGALRAGVVAIPVNTLWTAEDLRFGLADSRARALVVDASLLESFRPALADQPHLENVIVVGGPSTPPAGMHTLEALVAASPDAPFEASATTSDDVAFWLYSSGSTGRPKGVMHLHAHLFQTAALYGQGVLGIQPQDRVFSVAKLFFAYGLGNGMTFPLSVGATAVLHAGRPTPRAVLEVFEAHRPTVFYGVPTLYAAILADEANRPPEGLTLRRCVSAGEALPEEVGKRWEARFGCEILDGLGSTELLHIFLSNRPGDVRYGSSGRAVPGYDLRVVNDAGEDAADGEIGELWVRGPSAAMAYWNQRAKSLHTFRGRWTLTGDKYVRDAGGVFTYCGRADDMMKVSGQWCSPFEVESALVAHEAILEAAVVGRRDADDLLKPMAFVVLREGATLEDPAATLKTFVKERLSPWKYPRWVEVMDALPKTATGKIQRFKLRRRLG